MESAATNAHGQPQATSPHGLGRALPVAIFATVIPILGWITMLAGGRLLAFWLHDQGTIGALYFTIIFTLTGAIAFAPTYTTSFIAGWAFGFRLGFLSVVIGTVGGAILCYLTTRRFASHRVAAAFASHPKWNIVRRALLVEHPLETIWIVFLLRLSPVLPFGTTNVLLASSGVRFWIYLLGTILGLAPRLGLVAFAAASAEKLDLSSGESWWWLGLGLVATGICVVVMAIMGKHALERACGRRGELNPAKGAG